MWFAVAACLVSVLCLVVAARRGWALRGRPERVAELRALLRNTDGARAADQAGSDTLGEAVRGVLLASSVEQARARLNEHLADVARDLDVGADVPRSAARVALASGTGLAVAALASGMARGVDANTVTAPLVAFSAGVVGLIGATVAGRLAEVRAERLRSAYDDLARALTRMVAAE